ncbi:collagen alpha-1(XII) chain-like [Trematomus bernacchii]|uniref:collagen alpha-1(XII) chain-like n=1 Tax=Trematomus bernacchii TaxID=40690 RepID=UPI00146E7C74|nr:collagen alpha-1(XII) chain-like [Trematomus bernacchii]
MKMKMFLAAAALLALLLSSSHAQDTGTKCNTTAQADLVLLVDGSWSVGRLNFKTIRNFLARMVSVFDISPDRVQIGLAQYSGDPKTEWHLNAHSTKDSLLDAIANLPYKGGNTMTGMALNYILQNNFKTSAGMRKNSRKIGILITDGKSQDEIVFTSQSLRENGIELYAVGVKNANEDELRAIASDPDDIHMYNVNEFMFLLDIVDELTINLCNSVKDPVPLSAVKNMNVYDETSTTMKVRWGAAEGATGYMMLYRATNATEPQLEQEVRVGGEVTDVQLVQLTPSTAYSISLYALHGDALEGTGVTCAASPSGAPNPQSGPP